MTFASIHDQLAADMPADLRSFIAKRREYAKRAPIRKRLASLQAELNHDDCIYCEGDGRLWNNADPTSGQWIPCTLANRS